MIGWGPPVTFVHLVVHRRIQEPVTPNAELTFSPALLNSRFVQQVIDARVFMLEGVLGREELVGCVPGRLVAVGAAVRLVGRADTGGVVAVGRAFAVAWALAAFWLRVCSFAVDCKRATAVRAITWTATEVWLAAATAVAWWLWMAARSAVF